MRSFHFETHDSEDADSIKDPVLSLFEVLDYGGLRQGGYIRWLHEFSDGKTESRVILVEVKKDPGDLQPHHLVLKIGPIGSVRRELERYIVFKGEIRAPGAFVELLDPERTRHHLEASREYGAIAYHSAQHQLAGSDVVSLKDLFGKALSGEVPLERVSEAFSATFRALSSLYGKPKEAFAFKIPEYYLERWFPDFQLKVEKIDIDSGLLTRSKYDSRAFKGMSSRELRRNAENPKADSNLEIAAANLKCLGIWKDTLGLRHGSMPSDHLHIQVDVSKLGTKERSVLREEERFGVWALANDSRMRFYRRRIEQAFPGLSLDAPVFLLDELKVPNPLRQPSKPLRELASSTIRLVPAHGDLHPGNVLVVGETPVIIDYGLAESELPIGVDAVRLFGCLVRDVLAEVVDYSVLVRLLPDVLGLTEASEAATGAEQVGRLLLGSLWKEIETLLDREGGRSQDAALLSAHLYGFAWIGLKWSGSSAAWRACFLMACLAARIWQGKEPPGEGPKLWPTTWSLISEKLREYPISAAILEVIVFLEPESIPLELMTSGAPEIGPGLAIHPEDGGRQIRVVADALERLIRNAFLERDLDTNTYRMDPDLQRSLRDDMEPSSRRRCAERSVRAVNRAFPDVERDSWPLCKRLLPQAEVAIKLTEAYGLDIEAAVRLFNQTGLYCREQSYYEKAEIFYKRALEVATRIHGSAHSLRAAILYNLGELYYAQDRYDDAEPHFQESLKIRTDLLDEGHPDIALNLDSLAMLFEKQGRYDEAEPLYDGALRKRERFSGGSHLDIALSCNNLAVLYRKMGQYDEAEDLYKRALRLRLQILEPEHPHVAISLNNLALLYCHQGRYDDSETYYNRALEIREKALGPEHLDVAESLDNLAVLFENMDRYDEAEPLFKRALSIREATLGPDHLDVAASFHNLAGLYYVQANLQEAEALHRRALEIRHQKLPTDHPEVVLSLHSLAMLYNDQNLHGVAEMLFKMSLTIREKILGRHHPEVAESLDSLARLYHDRSSLREAEPLYERALEIRERTFGSEHLYVTTSLNNLAVINHKLHRYEAAEILLKRAAVIGEKSLGPEHPDVLRTLKYYEKVHDDHQRSLSRNRPG